MKSGIWMPVSVLCAAVVFALVGCEEQNVAQATSQPSPEKAPVTEQPKAPSAAVAANPAAVEPKMAAHPPMTTAAKPSPAPPADKNLALDGLAMTVPDGWLVAPPAAKPSPMAPKVIYSLPNADGDGPDATVRITYFPNMKGMNDANIARWVGQVRRPDGTPSTRDDAKITEVENGSVHLTIVDVSGAVNASMGHAGGGDPGQRMIVAVVDHPKGPHFIKALGDTATIEKWHETIHAFLKSAAAN
jgi:hypothetical protein